MTVISPAREVLRLHQPGHTGDCSWCEYTWPCDTARILAGERPVTHVPYVGWGGKFRERPVTTDLGYSAHGPLPPRGPRRAVWDIAYGIVNGFPASAILWFVLTRSLPPRRVGDAIIRWEEKRRATSPG